MGGSIGGLTTPNSAMIGPSGQTEQIASPQKIWQEHQNQVANTPMTPPGGTPPQLPKVGTPSYAEAAGSGGAGSPGLTKAGKLAMLLTSGLQGALAGRQSSEEAVIQSGGRRSGGAGMGFEAGYMLPFQRAAAEQQLEQQRAQTGVLQSEAQTINIPGVGPIPGWLAKQMGPAYLRQQGQLGVQELKGPQAQALQQQKNTGALQKQSAANVGAAQVAGINKRFIAVPNVGLYDTQAGSIIPGTQQGTTITPEIAKDYGLPDGLIGKPMTLAGFASMENAQRFNEQPVEGAAGPALVNRNPASPQFGQVLPLGLGNPSLGRVVQVADPNNPGQVTYTTAGQAIQQGPQQPISPQSAPSRAARSTAVSAASGPIGQQITAFNTALQHADLLQQAMTALGNGDQRTLNALKNAFKTEFGSSDVTNFQTIGEAYTREINKMLSSGHLTDSEIKTVGATIPAKASPQQILGALQAYRALATSKMNVLQQQVQQGMKGQPNFPTNQVQPQAQGARTPFGQWRQQQNNAR